MVRLLIILLKLLANTILMQLIEKVMYKAKSHIENLETDGIYLADNEGISSFIPWKNVDAFRLNTHQKRYSAEIVLKDNERLTVRISEPFLVAQRIYRVLFNHGDEAAMSLPKFEIT
ncbi:hypothetical protein GC194_14450 [bacterium]|nr:hypothetical protein [bacterium]